MGILDKWPFVKREEIARREREFDERMFPFGFEEQRNKMRETLAELIPTPASKMQYLLFACLLAKDKYMMSGWQESGLVEAKKLIDKVLKSTEDEKRLILTLARMDTEAKSLESYPTAEEVRKEARLVR
jgi:hypothetical protein